MAAVSEPRCRITDMLDSQCAHCRAINKRAATLEWVSEEFPETRARWAKKCPGCGTTQIQPGDKIYKIDDDWCCRGCASS